jgi:hypothetical protein
MTSSNSYEDVPVPLVRVTHYPKCNGILGVSYELKENGRKCDAVFIGEGLKI